MAAGINIRKEIASLSEKPVLTVNLLDAFERELRNDLFKRVLKHSNAEVDKLLQNPDDVFAAERLRAFTASAAIITQTGGSNE